MFVYPIYKAIKQRLNAPEAPQASPALLGNVFFYINQYLPGKDNTSYKVPALYIEMPKNSNLQFYGRKLLAAKNAPIKIHYISYAPFKNHDNAVQDSAIAAHENTLREIDLLLNGWNVTDANGRLLTQQLIPTNAAIMQYIGDNLISVITYTTEIYSRHLQAVPPQNP